MVLETTELFEALATLRVEAAMRCHFDMGACVPLTLSRPGNDRKGGDRRGRGEIGQGLNITFESGDDMNRRRW